MLVDIPKQLRFSLEDEGWEIAAIEEPDVWWSPERWLLRSTWSPQGHEVYLTFIVDPHPSRKQKIMALKASLKPPVIWYEQPLEFMLYFGHHWQRHVGKLVEYLSELRNQGAIGES